MSYKHHKSSKDEVIVNRKYATKVVETFAYGISLSADPELSATVVSNLFAKNARFCSPTHCVVGKENIKAEFLRYLNQNGEKDQFIQINNIIWDQEKLSGAAQVTWGATVIKDNYIPGVVAGQSYTQDDIHFFELNKKGKATFWIESFNPNQQIAFICPSKKALCCRRE